LNASTLKLRPRRSVGGWTLIELVVTVTVLTILTLGIVPLIKTSVKRQREQQLRETLRGMR
jgi:general secretion pathway protein G